MALIFLSDSAGLLSLLPRRNRNLKRQRCCQDQTPGVLTAGRRREQTAKGLGTGGGSRTAPDQHLDTRQVLSVSPSSLPRDQCPSHSLLTAALREWQSGRRSADQLAAVVLTAPLHYGEHRSGTDKQDVFWGQGQPARRGGGPPPLPPA